MERRATTVPMAVVVGRCSIGLATAAATDSIGSGWFARPASEASIEAGFRAESHSGACNRGEQ